MTLTLICNVLAALALVAAVVIAMVVGSLLKPQPRRA